MPHNILFVDHAQAIGGAENSLQLLMRNLDSSQWQPHLATTNGRFAQTAQQTNIPTHLLAFPQLRRSASFGRDWWYTAQNLAKLAQSLDAQILHANTIRAALYTSLAAKLAKRPFIWHMRDFWLSENKPKRLWLDSLGKQLLISASTFVIANSAATATHLPASDKIKVIHNGIDLAKFEPTPDKFSYRQAFDIPRDAPVVGMVGRLRPWKGQTYFLQMAAQIAATNPNVYFLVVGGTTFSVDETYPQQLKNLAQELDISDKVIFSGQTDNVPQALAAMDVFVHPGDPEPFGLVNIEAMAMKKPVVAFAHGALPEIVVNEETGFLVPPYEVDTLAEKANQLLNNPVLRGQLGENGRLRVKQNFNISTTTQKILALYNAIKLSNHS